MKPSEIKVKLKKIIAENQEDTAWTLSGRHLITLVNQVIREEREACAKECENIVARWRLAGFRGELNSYAECAAVIRARGEQDGETGSTL